MTVWLKKLKDQVIGAPAPRVFLAAFGKHPGWQDHMDDLGLETDALVAARLYIYLEGIGGSVDRGYWEGQPDGAVRETFNHAFLWQAGEDLLLGRIWSSRDGANRTLYPMILCAHFEQASAGQTAPAAWPMLAEVEAACRATDSAEEVARILGEGQARLRQLVPGEAPPPSGLPEAIGVVSGPETLARLAYALEVHLGPLKERRRALRLDSQLAKADLIPQTLRLPAFPEAPEASFAAWLPVLSSLVDAGVPLLLVAPADEAWLDVVAGPVSSRELRCLRLTPAALPLASDVPYELRPEDYERAERLFPAPTSTREASGLDAPFAP